jgi:hypothetical protein
VAGELGRDPVLRKLSGQSLSDLPLHLSPEFLLAVAGELRRDHGLRELSGQSLSDLKPTTHMSADLLWLASLVEILSLGNSLASS